MGLLGLGFPIWAVVARSLLTGSTLHTGLGLPAAPECTLASQPQQRGEPAATCQRPPRAQPGGQPASGHVSQSQRCPLPGRGGDCLR